MQRSEVMRDRRLLVVIVTIFVILLLLLALLAFSQRDPPGCRHGPNPSPDENDVETVKLNTLDPDLYLEIKVTSIQVNQKPEKIRERKQQQDDSREKYKAGENLPPEILNLPGQSLFDLAEEAHQNGDLTRALKLYETCLTMAEKWIPQPYQARYYDDVQSNRHLILKKIWTTQMNLGWYDDALMTSQRLLQFDLVTFGENGGKTINTQFHLAQSLTLVQPPRTREAMLMLEKVKGHLDQGHVTFDSMCDAGCSESCDHQCMADIDTIWAHTQFHLAKMYHESWVNVEEAKNMFVQVWNRFARTGVNSSERVKQQDEIASTSLVLLAGIRVEEEVRSNPGVYPLVRVKVMQNALNLCKLAHDYMTKLHGEDQEDALEPRLCWENIIGDVWKKIKAEKKGKEQSRWKN